MDAKDDKILAGLANPNNSGIAAVMQTIRSIQKNAQTKSGEDILSTMHAQENASIPFTITEEEEECLVYEMQK